MFCFFLFVVCCSKPYFSLFDRLTAQMKTWRVTSATNLKLIWTRCFMISIFLNRSDKDCRYEYHIYKHWFMAVAYVLMWNHVWSIEHYLHCYFIEYFVRSQCVVFISKFKQLVNAEIFHQRACKCCPSQWKQKADIVVGKGKDTNEACWRGY